MSRTSPGTPSSMSARSPSKRSSPATPNRSLVPKLSPGSKRQTSSPNRGWTELHLAAARGEADAVQAHLDYAGTCGDAEAALNARDKVLGYTPLHYAAYWGHPAVVEYLVSRRADVNLTDNTGGSTALHLAALCGHVHAVKELLSAGAKPTAKNNDGKTPFDFAASPEVRTALNSHVRSQSPKDSPPIPVTDRTDDVKMKVLQEEVTSLRGELRNSMFSKTDDEMVKYEQRMSEIEYLLDKYVQMIREKDAALRAMQDELERVRHDHAEETMRLREALLEAEQARIMLQTRVSRMGRSGLEDMETSTISDDGSSALTAQSRGQQQQQHGAGLYLNKDFEKDLYNHLRQAPGSAQASSRALVSQKQLSTPKFPLQGGGGLVGMRLKNNSEGRLIVSEISAGGAAESCGLIAVGDYVMSVDGHRTKNMDANTAKTYIAGPPDSIVELKLQRGHRKKKFTVRVRRRAPPSAMNTPVASTKNLAPSPMKPMIMF